MIVCGDADVDRAATMASVGRFLTAVRSVSPSKDFICSKISRGKQNGLGREHGYEALEHYLETKGVVVET